MNQAFKVLTEDQRSPYQDFPYELNKWYTTPNFGEKGDNGCIVGLYATPIEGLLYRGLWHRDEYPYLCETKGRCHDTEELGKQCWEHLRVIRRLEKKEVDKLAKQREEKLSWKVGEALYPVNPTKIPFNGDVTDKQIQLLKDWISIIDPIRKSFKPGVKEAIKYSYGQSVEYSVCTAIWDSVGFETENRAGNAFRFCSEALVRNQIYAYTGSLFPNIKWPEKITPDSETYPFQSAVDLWKQGLLISFDDTDNNYHLHKGTTGEILHSITTI